MTDDSVLGRVLVLIVRVETTNINRRIGAHPARQLNRVCIALEVQYTKGTNVFWQ